MNKYQGYIQFTRSRNYRCFSTIKVQTKNNLKEFQRGSVYKVYCSSREVITAPAAILIDFCFVSSETKRYCFQFRGELFTQWRQYPIRVKFVIVNVFTAAKFAPKFCASNISIVALYEMATYRLKLNSLYRYITQENYELDL